MANRQKTTTEKYKGTDQIYGAGHRNRFQENLPGFLQTVSETRWASLDYKRQEEPGLAFRSRHIGGQGPQKPQQIVLLALCQADPIQHRLSMVTVTGPDWPGPFPPGIEPNHRLQIYQATVMEIGRGVVKLPERRGPESPPQGRISPQSAGASSDGPIGLV